jgi:hypothetical protein
MPLKRFLPLLISVCLFQQLNAQTPINLSSQVAYTYTETFSDIANWAYSTSPVNGLFTVGTGAAAWKGYATVATGTVPDGKKITAASTAFASGSGGGVQKGTNNLVMLATGTTDNTSATAIDFFMDFTGLSAGTFSFDWSSVNNSSGDRKSSLKIYTSTDGITFTELVAAGVANITNNSITYGSVSNVNLPASLDGSASARIRFYLYNGTGGTIGSRPKISLDNVKVTATSSVSCATPANQPSSLILTSPSSTTIQGSFTNAASAPDRYLVLLSSNSSLSNLPVNGQTYSPGDNIGDASVVDIIASNSFTVTSLNPSTGYYLYVFSMNAVCSGGPNYQTVNPLTGQSITGTDLVPCVAPAAQPTFLSFNNITTTSMQGNFTASASADEYLVVKSSSATLSGTPSNTQVYNAGDALGGGIVISRSASSSFIANSLNDGTAYYFFVFALNSQNCTNGPIYLTTSPLTSNASTLNYTGGACAAPTYQPSNLVLTGNNTSITGSFSTSVDADSYLVLYSTSSSLSQTPSNNTNYAVGANFGNAKVLSNAAANSFYLGNLNASTTYYFFVFAQNSDCSGGTKYLVTAPLQGSRTTTATGSYNYYFGNLHAHSGYSDGNKDHNTYTPADDYAYAKNSLGLDFLGISEHNHSGAGMVGSDYPLGVAQATAATSSSFVALYGQEWGVISGGGHVLVYGIDSLIGWETNNYQVFVPKSDYTGTPTTTGTTGLFRTLNQQGNAFASYAHPDNSDYNSVYSLPYNATVDSAVIGSAVESGPAFSTSTAYNDYPSSMSFLSYYTKMLAKGYHLGPFMDHDTHYTNFGRANEDRLVVLAPTLTKADLFAALKAKRFYATQDIDTRVNLTVNNQPLGSIFTGNTAPVINITATDPTSPSSTPSIKIYSGIPGTGVIATQLTSANAVSLSYVDNTVANGATVYYYADITINGKRTITAPIWYTRNNCSMDNTNPVAVWTGSASTAFSNAANWCSGTVPPSGSNITVATGSANMPQLAGTDNYTINNLVVQSGTTLTLNGGTLKIKGIIANNGTLDVSSGTLEFNGTTAQSIPVLLNNMLENLIINNPAGVAMSYFIRLSGTLTLTSGLLNTNHYLTLTSTAAGTARIAAITGGSITGFVTQERYIPAKANRTWSLLASPFSTVILSSWQQQVHVTGAGTGGTACPNLTFHNNGFDATVNNAANMFVYDGTKAVGSRWTSVSSTTAINLTPGTGYRMNIRGPRSMGCSLLNGTVSSTTAVTLSSQGNLNVGINMGSFSTVYLNNGNTTVSNDNYLFVGNPYPSQISFSALQTANNAAINNTYAIYVAGNTIGNYAFWNGSTWTGGNTGLSDATGDIIANGQAFFLQGKTAGSSITLNWTEAMKTASVNNGYFRQLNPNHLRIGYLLENGDRADEIMVLFDKKGTSTELNEGDIVSMNTGTQHLKSMKAANGLAFQTRNNQFTSDTVYLNVVSNRNGDFKLSFYDFEQFVQASNTSIYLVDRYTNSIQLMNNKQDYPFTVSLAQAASYGEGRFAVVFSRPSPMVQMAASIKAYPNPVLDQLTIELPATSTGHYSIRLMDLTGRLLLEKQGTGTLQLSMGGLANGSYLLETIDSKGGKTVQRVVKGRK